LRRFETTFKISATKIRIIIDLGILRAEDLSILE